MELYEKAIQFIEKLKHPEKTEWAGQPVVLLQWQKEYIRRLLETRDGLRIIRQAIMWVPKKNGKTTLLALLTVWFLFSEKNGQILCAANDKEQASILYRMVKSIIEQSPWLLSKCRIYKGNTKKIECYHSGSELNTLSSEAFTKNGANCSVFIGDEIGFFETSELWDAVHSGQINRSQPLMLGISTAGADTNSFGYELYEKTKRILGHPSEDDSFLPIIYEAPPKPKWDDIQTWYDCNPSLRELANEQYILSEIAAAKANPTELRRLLRYHLNVWVGAQSVEPWISVNKFDACSGTIDLDTLNGRTCYVGIDIASRNDMTCMALLFALDDGTFPVLLKYYMPADTLNAKEHEDKAPYSTWVGKYITTMPGDYMDTSQVRADLKELSQLYDVRAVGLDMFHNATDLTSNLQQDGYNVVWVGQGTRTVVPTAKELGLLIESKRLIHFGNPVLRWNFGNCRSKLIDDAGNELPSKMRSTGRIDGIYAIIDALSQKMAERTTKSAYEEKDSLFL